MLNELKFIIKFIPWKVWVGIGLLLLLVVGLAMAAGAYIKSDKVTTIEKEKVVEREVSAKTLQEMETRVRAEVTKELKERFTQELLLAKLAITKKTVIQKNPDGSVLITKDEKRESETKSDTKTSEKDQKDTKTDEKETKVVTVHEVEVREKIVEKEKIKIVQSDWLLGAQLGSPGLTGLKDMNFNYGASLDKRVLGSFFLGIFGNTTGNYGISIKWGF